MHDIFTHLWYINLLIDPININENVLIGFRNKGIFQHGNIHLSVGRPLVRQAHFVKREAGKGRLRRQQQQQQQGRIRKHTRRRGTRTTTTTSSTQREQQQRQPCTILCHHCDPSLPHWFGKQRGDGKATNRVNIPRHVSRSSIQRGNAVDLVSFFNETMGKPWNLLVDARFLCTLPKTNIFALESRPPKRKGIVFQPSIFRCKLAVSFREGRWKTKGFYTQLGGGFKYFLFSPLFGVETTNQATIFGGQMYDARTQCWDSRHFSFRSLQRVLSCLSKKRPFTAGNGNSPKWWFRIRESSQKMPLVRGYEF